MFAQTIKHLCDDPQLPEIMKLQADKNEPSALRLIRRKVKGDPNLVDAKIRYIKQVFE